MTDAIREDPPPIARSIGHELRAFAGQLRADPGEWYRFPKPVKESTSATPALPGGEFETTQRKRADGLGWDLYACYVGEG